MTPLTVASLPHLQLRCGGSLLPETVSAALLSLAVSHELNAPARCSFDLAELDSDANIEEALPFGGELIVSVVGQQDALFSGVIDGVTCERRTSREVRWRVEASDQLQALARNRRMRVFVQSTPAGIVREVANGYDLEVLAEEDGPMRERVVQHGETDLAFLWRLLDEASLSVAILGGVLNIVGQNGKGPRYSLDAARQVLDLRHSRSGREAPASVRFSGANFLTHQLHSGTARLEEGDGALGGEWSWSGAIENDAQAQRRAEAVAKRFQRATAVLEGTVEGEAKLHPGRRIRMEDAGTPFDGDYTVTRISHRIDAEGGFVTEFGTHPPDLFTPDQSVVAAYGTVTRLDDPEGQGRVQVALPAFGEVELGWLRVLTLGAGKNKGLVMLPDIDEDVLVLFPAGELSQAVVLGGIYRQSGHPEWGIEEKAVRRFALTSAAGQKVVLSDGRHSVRVENDIGSAIEIGEDKITIESKGDLEISAPGRAIRIVANTVDFVQG